MINISQLIKDAYNQSTTQTDKIILNGKEYKINKVDYLDDTYIDGNIFGTAIARQLSFEVEACNIEKQEFEYLTGIEVNGVIEWISLGNFITQDTQESDTVGMIKVEAMDYMLKTNIVYKSSLNYFTRRITIYDVAFEACQLAGLNLATNSLTNGNFIVDSNQFEEGTLIRQVIQAVAQISGTVAKIKSDNSLYFINPNQVTEVSKVFTLHDYSNIDIKRYTQPINTVVLGMKDIEGENVTLRDEEAVARDGENKIVFNDNPFAYTDAKRHELIVPLFNALRGFEYKSVEIKGQAHPYLETLDKIQFKDMQNNTYNSYVFRFNYKSPNGLESTTEAPSITDATVEYENVMNAEEIAKRTEIIVDKQNQTIESVVNNVTEQNNKIARVEQTVDSLNSKISDIADITTSQETNAGVLIFEDINVSEPVHIEIKPLGESIRYLYPCDLLFPSDDLFIQLRVLRFRNTITNEKFDYELPDDLLYYDAENFDTLIMDYYNHVVYVNKKCKFNFTTREVELLEQEITKEYEFPEINLTEGDYIVEVPKYDNTPYVSYLMAKLMIKNEYTSQFATTAEVNSKITQASNVINLELEEKLDEENFTGANIMLAINNDRSSAQINADKIDLNGKEINMTAEHIKIKSDNFNVDEEGNIEAKSGQIGGWDINNEGLTNGDVFIKNNGYSSIYTIADLFIVRNYLLGTTGFDFGPNEIAHYDLNNDGVVDSGDLLLLRKMTLGY